MEKAAIQEAIKVVPNFLRMNAPHAWFDYDKEVDVLYVSFDRPQRADDSEMLPNNVIVRRRKKKLVGLTILDARRFIKQ